MPPMIKPRFLVGAIALILIGVLMLNGVVGEAAGLSMITAILSGLGVYHAASERDNGD